MSEKGKLIVISGPSGAGKSTVVFKTMETRSDLCFSTSVTTRAPRPGEIDGREYFFIDQARFDEMVRKDELLEHAEYVKNRYGTPRAYVQQQLEDGKNVVLDIEIQGARQVRRSFPDAVSIFVQPPSFEVLEERLRGRGTESEESLAKRLAQAKSELASADEYKYRVVNDRLDDAVADLTAILKNC